MKRIAMAVMVMGTAGMTGCADQQERIAQYQAYLGGVNAQTTAMKEAKPIVDATWIDSGGQPMKLTINLPVQFQEVQQIKNDESYAFWGQIIGATIPVIGNGFMAWSSNYYGYQNNKAMWGALGGSLGGGTRIDSGGGAVSLYGSGNQYRLTGDNGAEIQMTGFGFGYGQDEAQLDFGGQDAQEEGPTATDSYNPVTETETTTTTGGPTE